MLNEQLMINIHIYVDWSMDGLAVLTIQIEWIFNLWLFIFKCTFLDLIARSKQLVHNIMLAIGDRRWDCPTIL